LPPSCNKHCATLFIPHPHVAAYLSPAGFIAPCLPTKTDKLPSSSQWLHEIKHDGFRVIARKKGAQVRLYSRPGNDFTRRFPPIARALTHLHCRSAQVRLYSRPGNDFTRRFPPIARALTHLHCRSCIIDGEAVVCDDNGVTSFDHIRYGRAASNATTRADSARQSEKES